MTDLYCLVVLATLAAAEPAPLPADLLGLAPESLADLPAALNPVPAPYKGVGFWPVIVEAPAFDSREQRISDGYDLAVDSDARTVTATHQVRPLTPDEIAALPPPPVPQVSAVQAKTALYDAGLYDAVEAAIGGSAYPLVRIWWSSAQAWRMDHPYVLGMAAELGMTDDQVSGLFAAAQAVPT